MALLNKTRLIELATFRIWFHLISCMRVERKRSGHALSPQASSSSSSFRHNMTQRPPSPPASTYFPLLSADTDNVQLRPVADAESHFAYSTTLRRHNVEGSLTSPTEIAAAVNAEASSLWSRALGHITGQPESSLESRRGSPVPPQRQETKDTLSARFAHTSIQVRCLIVSRIHTDLRK